MSNIVKHYYQLWKLSKLSKIVKKNGKKSKIVKITNLSKLFKVVKIIENCQKSQNCQHYHKISKLEKIVKILNNCQNLHTQKKREIKLLIKSCLLVNKCLKGHKSLGSLWWLKSKGDWLTQWQGHLLSCQTRVDIWRDRWDRRSRKNLVNCVNF